jgi:hypothetical protein
VALLFSFMRGQHGRLGVRREPETGHINNTSDLSPPHSSDHFLCIPPPQDRRIQKPDPALPRTRVFGACISESLDCVLLFGLFLQVLLEIYWVDWV